MGRIEIGVVDFGSYPAEHVFIILVLKVVQYDVFIDFVEALVLEEIADVHEVESHFLAFFEELILICLKERGFRLLGSSRSFDLAAQPGEPCLELPLLPFAN